MPAALRRRAQAENLLERCDSSPYPLLPKTPLQPCSSTTAGAGSPDVAGAGQNQPSSGPVGVATTTVLAPSKSSASRPVAANAEAGIATTAAARARQMI